MDDLKRWEELPESLGKVTMMQATSLCRLPLKRDTTWICDRQRSTIRYNGDAVDAVLVGEPKDLKQVKYLWPISPAERAEDVVLRILISLAMQPPGFDQFLPGVLEVGDRRLRQLLRPLLRELGVEVVAPGRRDPWISDLLHELESVYRGPETWREHPEYEELAVRRLHESAAEFFRRTPWKRLSEFEGFSLYLGEDWHMVSVRGRKTKQPGLFLWEEVEGEGDVPAGEPASVARLRLSGPPVAHLPAARLEEADGQGWRRLPDGRLPHLVRRYPVLGLDQLASGRDAETMAKALEALCHHLDTGELAGRLKCGTEIRLERAQHVRYVPPGYN